MSKEQVVVARKKKKKVKIFPIVNVILFLVISLIIMVPIWKVIVDSFDAKAGYGMNFLPQTFTLGGYSSILSRVGRWCSSSGINRYNNANISFPIFHHTEPPPC